MAGAKSLNLLITTAASATTLIGYDACALHAAHVRSRPPGLWPWLNSSRPQTMAEYNPQLSLGPSLL